MPQLEVPDQIAAGWFAVEATDQPGSLQRSGSNSRLNAQAPEFVPRVAAVVPPPRAVVRVFAAPPPPPRAAFFAAPPPPPPFEFFVSVRVGGGFAAKEPELERAAPSAADPLVDGHADEVAKKITKQVEYYFSDINLATTEHLMRFISKDPQGYDVADGFCGRRQLHTVSVDDLIGYLNPTCVHCHWTGVLQEGEVTRRNFNT
uniref:Uncharacterized protein n=1 Tax=Avena sativa TaxID=4498 RepID=A0ACD5XSM0_AVESA